MSGAAAVPVNMDDFEAAQWHAKQSRDLRRVAKERSPALRMMMQRQACRNELMVRVYASKALIEACDALGEQRAAAGL